jgi:Zn-dependent M28 family amino/carboxypeptidase
MGGADTESKPKTSRRVRYGLTTIALTLAACRHHAAPPRDAARTSPFPEVAHLANEVAAHGHAFDHVRALTDAAGPRLAGSPGEAAAVAWAQRTMTALGLVNVHLEPATATHWTRGTESGAIVTETVRPVALAALGGSVATPPEGIEADVVFAPSIEALDAMPRDRVEGRIAFVSRAMRRTQDGSGYGEAVTVRGQAAVHAARLGARAVLIRSIGTDHDRFAHTGAFRYDAAVPQIPAAALSVPDAELLERLVTAQPVRFRLVLGGESHPDGPASNVVGEVPGSDRRDEVIVLGAHLDSWDLGQGALDDGAGCAIVLEAANAIAHALERPRRTVRVVLFANEENGIGGARAYATAHAGELDHHVAAMEADLGDGRVLEWRAPTAVASSRAAQLLDDTLAPLGVPRGQHDAHGGADIGPLQSGGVPLLDLRQDASHYFDVHHTANDTLAQVRPDELARAASVFTAAAYALARMEPVLGRVPPPPPGTH